VPGIRPADAHPAAAHELGMRSTAPADATPDPGVRDEVRDWTVDLADPAAPGARTAARELVDEVMRAVRGLRRRVGLSDADVQDAVGDTLLELTKRLRRGQPVPGAVVQKVAAAVSSRFVNGPVRHETAKALRLLKERVAAEEAKLGASLSRLAVERLAEEVRTGPDFNPRHRPVERFHLIEGFSKPASIDQFAHEVVDAMLHRATLGEERGYRGAAGACDGLLDQVQLGARTRRQAQDALWTVLAFDEGLPGALPGWVRREVAADLVAYVRALPEGVVTACRQHLDGRRTRATVALFAPFGELPDADEDAIARFLASRPAFATRIWESALKESSASAPRRSVRAQPQLEADQFGHDPALVEQFADLVGAP
jgi:hypothetical protein